MAGRILIVALMSVVTCAVAADKQVSIKWTGFGCRTTDDTFKLYKLATRDKQAAEQFGASNGCRAFTSGESVWITEPAPIFGMNGVRPKGDARTYFVPQAMTS